MFWYVGVISNSLQKYRRKVGNSFRFRGVFLFIFLIDLSPRLPWRCSLVFLGVQRCCESLRNCTELENLYFLGLGSSAGSVFLLCGSFNLAPKWQLLSCSFGLAGRMVKQPPSHLMRLLICFLPRKAVLLVPSPGDYKHPFFPEICAAGSVSPVLPFGYQEVLGIFQRGNNHSLSRTFSFCISLSWLLAFVSKVGEFPVPSSFSIPRWVCVVGYQERCL